MYHIWHIGRERVKSQFQPLSTNPSSGDFNHTISKHFLLHNIFLEAELFFKPLCPSVGLSGCNQLIGPFLSKITGRIVTKIDTHILLIYQMQIVYILQLTCAPLLRSTPTALVLVENLYEHDHEWEYQCLLFIVYNGV